MRRIAIILATLALAACGKSDNDQGPGDVTVGEARALDDAAEMIEKQKPDVVQPPVPVKSAPAAIAS